MSETTTDRDNERRVDLVFEGGGVKGLALVGALTVLEERGYKPQSVAGSSAGALLAALLGAGYTAAELREIFLDFDFATVRDTSWEDRIPLIGTPLSLLKDQGVYEGKALLKYVRGLLADKRVHRFGDLVSDENAVEERHRYKAQVIASDITGRRLLVLPRDARRLGVEDPDSFDVALAVRMSTSIPFYFEPVEFRNPSTGRKHLIVDGGVLSNFPVWLFDSGEEPRWPTFGLRLVEPEPELPLDHRMEPAVHPSSSIGTTIDYVRNLIYTMMEAHDRLYIEMADFARTICIPTLGVRTTNFDISREQRLDLYEAGRAAAEQFLESWSFERYLDEFRSGEEHSRRQAVVQRMQQPAEESG
ncbi:patatin-like phospholipase family protein [soil metagenome]